MVKHVASSDIDAMWTVRLKSCVICRVCLVRAGGASAVVAGGASAVVAED